MRGRTLNELVERVVQGKMANAEANSDSVLLNRLLPVLTRGMQTEPAKRWPSLAVLSENLRKAI